MMTLNGGLWYSVASLDLAPMAQRGVLWFTAFANIVMIAGLWRRRKVMQSLLLPTSTIAAPGLEIVDMMLDEAAVAAKRRPLWRPAASA